MSIKSSLPPITLVIGGARSGKSEHAELLVAQSGLSPFYLATATAGDGEMMNRIIQHQERRGDKWQTVEEPVNLVAALKKVNRNISPFVKIGASLCRSYFTPELAIKPTTQTAFNCAMKHPGSYAWR